MRLIWLNDLCDGSIERIAGYDHVRCNLEASFTQPANYPNQIKHVVVGNRSGVTTTHSRVTTTNSCLETARAVGVAKDRLLSVWCSIASGSW